MMWKSSLKVSLATLGSRVLGLLRDTLLSVVVGSGADADALFVALKIPNFFRRIFAEGVFSQGFVPMLSKIGLEERAALERYKGEMLAWLTLIVGVFTILGSLFAEQVIRFYAPGFEGKGDFPLAVSLFQVSSFYLLLICLVSFLSSVANAEHLFLFPSLMPILYNCVFIFALFFLLFGHSRALVAIPYAIDIAAFLQLLCLCVYLRRKGVILRFNPPRMSKEVRATLKLFLPVLASAAAVQVNLLFMTRFAASLPRGSVSWLDYADRLMALPVALVGVALGFVVLPFFSKHAVQSNAREFKKTLRWGFVVCVWIGAPSAVGLYLEANAFSNLLFGYGRNTPWDVSQIALALQMFALSVPFTMMAKVCTSALAALRKTRLIMFSSFLSVAVNLLGVFLLEGPMLHRGLALSVSLASIAQSVFLLALSLRSIQGLNAKTGSLEAFFEYKPLLQILVALGLMGLSLWGLNHLFSGHEKALIVRFLGVGSALLLGAVVYFGALRLLRFPFARMLKQ